MSEVEDPKARKQVPYPEKTLRPRSECDTNVKDGGGGERERERDLVAWGLDDEGEQKARPVFIRVAPKVQGKWTRNDLMLVFSLKKRREHKMWGTLMFWLAFSTSYACNKRFAICVCLQCWELAQWHTAKGVLARQTSPIPFLIHPSICQGYKCNTVRCLYVPSGHRAARSSTEVNRG